MPKLQGTSVNPGLALGPVHVVRARAGAVPVWSIRAEDVAGEARRLEEALGRVDERLSRQQEIVRESAGEQEAGIFAVHRMILSDPSARESVAKAIDDERINAEAAVQELVERLRRTMGQLDGDSVRDYAADVSEPWRAVLAELLQRDREQVNAAQGEVVLAAEELTPQVVSFLDRGRILGIITETGGRFSHGAVLARSFGIPCIVGLPNLLARLEQDMLVLVDGDLGSVQLSPGDKQQAEFLERKKQRTAREEHLSSFGALQAITSDGAALSVSVNLESVHDLGTFEGDYCDGVGLLRTEFLYMERAQFPSEEEQFRLYRRLVDRFQGKPVTIRTLDIGGDKELPYFTTPAENNPALGWRGVRITLEWQDLMRVQLRALLRASAEGDVRVLLPMVGSLDEVRTAHRIFDEVRSQLTEQGYEIAAQVPVGVMVEVPSTILILKEILAEVDFVSIGTNDLVQYLLAVDRDNPLVSKLYDPYHPAVVRALQQIAAEAEAAGVPCTVCGEVAGDQAYALLLLGMGVTGVSLAPHFLAEVRYAVRRSSMARLREMAQAACAASSSAEVRELLVDLRRELHEELEAQEGGA